MPKYQMESTEEIRSAFFERRRLRRIRMIVELTHDLISSDRTVTSREARCLVSCARKAILDLHPSFESRYDRIVKPHFERVLAERWPQEQMLDLDTCGDDLVN
ncbi:MAG TPA: hypothetical protein VGJ81_21685 [Thermoanaerobaculia bacterium]